MRIALPVLLLACGDGGDGVVRAAGWDYLGPAGPDAGQDAVSWPGTGISGAHRFQYAFAAAAEGRRNCDLHWTLSGRPGTAPCEGCTYVFDVELAFDEGASFDDGTCASMAGDALTTWGYSPDYYGYGPAWMVEIDGAMVWYGHASLEGDSWSWWWGWYEYYLPASDAPKPQYKGTWFTNWSEGAAVLY